LRLLCGEGVQEAAPGGAEDGPTAPDGPSSQGACGIHPDAGQLDLLLSISGFSYPEIESDAAEFRVAQANVRVGSLEKLLRSKQASGRPKDLEFLRAFEARASDAENDS